MRVQTALYRTGPSGPSETVYCRLNSKITPSGDLKGTSLAYAETVETEPRLIFLREEHRPARTWVYVLEAGEAYRVDHVEPDDTITVTAVCTRLSKEDVAAYEPPYGG
jgi:hypothetical protein